MTGPDSFTTYPDGFYVPLNRTDAFWYVTPSEKVALVTLGTDGWAASKSLVGSKTLKDLTDMGQHVHSHSPPYGLDLETLIDQCLAAVYA